MPKHKLSAAKVRSAQAGKYEDGAGLRLVVSEQLSRSWVLRYTINGKRREMGLGSFDNVSLAQARKQAGKFTKLAAEGKEPRHARDNNVKAAKPTFSECEAALINTRRNNPESEQLWERTFKDHVSAKIGAKPIDKVTTDDVLDCLKPIWNSHTEAARLVHNRIEVVFDYATEHRYRKGPSPARWRGHLDTLLPSPKKSVKPVQQPAFHAQFLKLPASSTLSLQDQICELISTGIVRDQFPRGEGLPSCRGLSLHLGVSRSTVHEAYCRLIDIGLIESRDRSGYYVCQHATSVWPDSVGKGNSANTTASPLSSMLPKQRQPSAMRKVDHPANWREFPYPFIYNQIDAKLFPLRDWRECIRVAMRTSALTQWSGDAVDAENANLVRQLQQRLLAFRGISASKNEIMITSGAQNALYLMATLNSKIGGSVAVEDPCYPEARNAFSLSGNNVYGVPVDEDGLIIEKISADTSLVYTTPSHQFPTTVTMSLERREALISLAIRNDFLICEDDYEAEMNFIKGRTQPIRALDRTGRVVYVGSLSKCVAPGLRLGYMVAHPDIINEARAIRRSVMRHPPGLLQEAMAGFIGGGFLDAHLRRMERRFRSRWETTLEAMSQSLPHYRVQANQGGTSIWVTSQTDIDSSVLAHRLKRRGVLIDEGGLFYDDAAQGKNSFRLGFAALSKNAIHKGIGIIAEELENCTITAVH